jgi:hypothetical protein
MSYFRLVGCMRIANASAVDSSEGVDLDERLDRRHAYLYTSFSYWEFHEEISGPLVIYQETGFKKNSVELL